MGAGSRDGAHQVVKLTLNSGQIVKNVGVIELQVVEYGGAWPVMYKFAALAELDPLLCYALKANGNLALLDVVRRAGAGFDVVSGGELARVLSVGAKPSTVVFAGVGKTVAEMEQALKAGILAFNVESEEEVEVLAAVAARVKRRAGVAIRVNPDVDPKTHTYISTGTEFDLGDLARAIAERTGFPAATLRSAVDKIAEILPEALAEH